MLTKDSIESALHYMEAHGLIRLSRPTGKWYQLYCPFHNSGQERKPSCGCSLEGEVRNGVMYNPGTFHCFSCSASYSFSKGVAEILKSKGTSLAAHPELEQYINNDDRAQVESLVPPEMMGQIISKYAADSLRLRAKSATSFVSNEELASYRFTVPYMYQRRLTDEVIARYDVGYDANHIPAGRSKPLPCITFPVRDAKGRTLFFCRRSIEGKYFNYPQGVTKPVYGIYELPKNCKSVIVCESVFNALTAVVYGYNAVALLGTGNAYQIDQLKQLGVSEYILCLDPDDAGAKGTEKLKKALQNSGFVWTIHMTPGKDLNDCTKEEFDLLYSQRD